MREVSTVAQLVSQSLARIILRFGNSDAYTSRIRIDQSNTEWRDVGH